MNVLAASSLLDAYSVPSVAFVTYSDSLAEALFSTFFQLVKGPSLGIKTSKADTHPGFLPPQNTYYRGIIDVASQRAELSKTLAAPSPTFANEPRSSATKIITVYAADCEREKRD
ncbi:hypothetical protein V6N11_080496 [Hibiscus sabdariffa]|uniref:Uncharacterized protein n=1 Tax=Hibiscus sabdariffa TaxID=183260 RepID=A0ABR2AGW9_9ROSI